MKISKRIRNVKSRMSQLEDFFTHSAWANHKDDPDVCDFALGNPHETVVPGFIAALRKHSEPQNKDWYAYKDNETKSQEHIAKTLHDWRGLPFQSEDIFLTNGAFAAISVALHTILDPGDEVIFISPPWFFYETLIMAAGGKPIRVKCDFETFDLDIAAIEKAITEKTRAVIINTPNNPTGRIYPAKTLQALASLLTKASERIGYPIYLLSDEAYSRIVFDNRDFHSPTEFYSYTLLIYTYSKTLLTPGQRIGYIALTPDMPNKALLREALFTSQLMTGYAFPNALLQHALPDIEPLSIDVQHYQHKRDKLVTSLRDMGYDVTSPEGTFYLLARSPLEDDRVFLQKLADHNVFCLPGTLVEMPGYFRISLTANDGMIARALPTFHQVLRAISKDREIQA